MNAVAASPSAAAIVRAGECDRNSCPCHRTAASGADLTHCPVSGHHDGSPSLNVTAVDGRVLFHDHGGCSQVTVLEALRERGLWPDATRNGEASKTVYKIRGLDGSVEAHHERTDLPDGKKAFAWSLPDSTTVGLNGRATAALPLYGTEQLDGLEPGTTVSLCEGQKPTDAIRATGRVALGTVTGAAGTPGLEALRPLVGFDVVLWPDNDHAGRQHMERVAAQLGKLGVTARLLHWRDAPPKGDAADFFAAGGTNAALAEMLSAGTPVLRPAETNLTFKTAREIAAETPAAVDWIVEPWVAKGAITELDGKIKWSGKTTWKMALARKALDGLLFMGKPTRKTGIVFLSEQAPRSFRAALARAGLTDRDDLVVLFWHATLGIPWPEVVRLAAQEAKRRGYELLVVDTLGQFAGITGDSENNAGAALEAMRPLQEVVAKDELAVLVSRHERKSGGDVGDSARGSSAFGGAVDIVLSLRRPEGQTRDTVRVIHALSRFDETPSELVIELVDGEYRALGSEQDVKTQETRTMILEILPTSEGEALTMDELKEALKATKVGRTTVHQVVTEYVTSGTAIRIGAGKRKDPFKYWRPSAKVSAGTPVVPAESNGQAEARGEMVSAALKGEVPAESNGVAGDEYEEAAV